MTVDSENNRDSFDGNNSTTLFPYTFRIFAKGDILVTLVVDSTGVETVQVVDVDYTVNTITQTGGDLTMTTAPDNGETLVYTRLLAKTQGVDLTRDGSLPAETLEQSIDRVTMITQELSEIFDRTITLQITSSLTAIDFPLPVASELIAWNAAADALETVVNPATAAAASAAAAAADAVLTAADVVSTNADVVTTNADVVLTNADVVLTNADVVAAAASAASVDFGNLIFSMQVFS